MARYLLEVPHESGVVACARANKILLETGSHFLTHADVGCNDGVHKAWIVVDVSSKEEARNMLPPCIVVTPRSWACPSVESRSWTSSFGITNAERHWGDEPDLG
jgi:hypothetical protein